MMSKIVQSYKNQKFSTYLLASASFVGTSSILSNTRFIGPSNMCFNDPLLKFLRWCFLLSLKDSFSKFYKNKNGKIIVINIQIASCFFLLQYISFHISLIGELSLVIFFVQTSFHLYNSISIQHPSSHYKNNYKLQIVY